MRAFFYQQQKRLPVQRIRREELPACALFLLVYAVGISCGIACGAEAEGRNWLPCLGLCADGIRQTAMLRVLLYGLCTASAHMALVLLAGLSGWFLPFWVGALLVRSIAVGVCGVLCFPVLQTGLPAARIFAAVMIAVFLIPFGTELRIGILPLVRRIEPDATDAEYLSAACRLMLRYLLVSTAVNAAALLALRCGYLFN